MKLLISILFFSFASCSEPNYIKMEGENFAKNQLKEKVEFNGFTITTHGMYFSLKAASVGFRKNVLIMKLKDMKNDIVWANNSNDKEKLEELDKEKRKIESEIKTLEEEIAIYSKEANEFEGDLKDIKYFTLHFKNIDTTLMMPYDSLSLDAKAVFEKNLNE